MTQTKLASYKLFIVPGGNSITIRNNLTLKATTTVRNAVSQNGLNYLGRGAGGFFGGFSSYHKVLNLTSGVWFKFFADYYNGKHKEAVTISFPARRKLDIYWQDGPRSSPVGGKLLASIPTERQPSPKGSWERDSSFFPACTRRLPPAGEPECISTRQSMWIWLMRPPW